MSSKCDAVFVCNCKFYKLSKSRRKATSDSQGLFCLFTKIPNWQYVSKIIRPVLCVEVINSSRRSAHTFSPPHIFVLLQKKMAQYGVFTICLWAPSSTKFSSFYSSLGPRKKHTKCILPRLMNDNPLGSDKATSCPMKQVNYWLKLNKSCGFDGT